MLLPFLTVRPEEAELWLKYICKKTLQLVPKALPHDFVAFPGWDIIVPSRKAFHISELTYVPYICSVSKDFSIPRPQLCWTQAAGREGQRAV